MVELLHLQVLLMFLSLSVCKIASLEGESKSQNETILKANKHLNFSRSIYSSYSHSQISSIKQTTDVMKMKDYLITKEDNLRFRKELFMLQQTSHMIDDEFK